jgi:pyruvate-formate lyase
MALSKKMHLLKDRLFDIEFHDPGVWYFTDTNILDEMPWLVSEPLVVRKAYAQKYMGEHLPAVIKPDELITGRGNQNSVGWGTIMPIYYTEKEGREAARHQLNEASVWGHHPPRWDKILSLGVKGVAEEISRAVEDQLAQNDPDDLALMEYRAMLIALDGVAIFAKRHADAALKEACSCTDQDRRAELLTMNNNCRRVPMLPAETFAQALQAFWFTYCIVNSGGEYIPLGRADQILYPYYEKDIREGVITKEEARDLMASFLVKCNEKIVTDTKKAENHYNFGLFSQGVIPDEKSEESGTNQTGGYNTRALTWQDDQAIDSDANFNYGQSGNDWLMNCMVGGQTPDGKDATNDLSYMILEIMNEMNLLMPTMGARIHKNSPPEFMDTVARVLRYGQGEPVVYNDEVTIKGFVDFGIPIQEARDYSNDGCWETLIPGKSYFTYAHVMNLRCVEWVLFRGISQHNKKMEGLDTGDPRQFKTFEEFYEAYAKQVKEYIGNQCKRRLESFGLSYMVAPDPLMSSLMDDCILKGRDITQNGSRYYFHQILVTGFANTVDALEVIRELVYEKKVIGLNELIRALSANWEGYEPLRMRAANSVPKFGNSNEKVDALGVRMLKDFEDYVEAWNRRDLPVKFPCGIGTFENYAALGRDIGASADGRFDKEALAPNYAPQPGADIKGPTAAIKSATLPNLSKYFSGAPFDLSVNSNDFLGEVGIGRLSSLIRSFCDLGGQIMTITSVNVEDLKDAKVNPEKHKNIRVRMGGLSAYFIAMSPMQQDNIIKRFEK